MVEIKVILENSEIFDFPLELYFLQKERIEKRIVTLSSKENVFNFVLPFNPEELVIDAHNKFLKQNLTILKKN